MSQSFVELTKELTLVLIETGYVLPDNVQETLEKTCATPSALKAQEEMGTTITVPVSETQPMDWRKSITRHAVICLECGQSFKQLSRHLRLHGLDDCTYRTKHRIPHAQPLSARNTTARRRPVVQETRPWEKAPRFIRAHAHNGPTLSEPKTEVTPAEIEEPTAKAPTQPKRKCQTTLKKTTRKKRSVE